MPAMVYPEKLLQTRQSLIDRLKDHADDKSWEEFFNTYWKLIYGFAVRSGLSDAEAQEVVQETIIGISKQMPKFQYDRSKGSFKKWLLRLTRWRIEDHQRKRKREAARVQPLEDSDDGTQFLDRIPDPAAENDAIWDEEWERNLLESALQRLKPKVRPRHYQIFDLYVVKNWPISKVTATLGVNVGQVYLVRHRLTALLRREIQSIESKP